MRCNGNHSNATHALLAHSRALMRDCKDPRGIQQDMALNFSLEIKGIIVFEEELRNIF